MSAQMVTANRLQDGIVVYLTKGGNWSTQFEDGDLLADKETAEAALAAAEESVKACRVLSVYLIDVEIENGKPKPTSTREHIRASGQPTVKAEAGSWTGRIGD